MNLKKSMVCMLAIVMLLLAACGNKADSGETGKEKNVELTISAAASLTDALGELKSLYEARHEGVTLSYNFGASGALQQQIEQGAPADLFLSASTKNMKALVDGGYIEESDQANWLKNELVVVVPAGQEGELLGLGDLTSDAVKVIAIGIPESVPAGGYAKEALTSAGLWEQLEPELVQAKDVRQVLQYVETGNADVGFVYKTDALSTDKTAIAFTVDAQSYSPVNYPSGIVKNTDHREEAKAFYDYLRTQEALDVLIKYGFTPAS